MQTIHEFVKEPGVTVDTICHYVRIRLLRTTQGTLEVENKTKSQLKESQLPAIPALKIGFVFQAFNLLDALRVEENLLFPARLKPGGISSVRQRVSQLFEQLQFRSI